MSRSQIPTSSSLPIPVMADSSASAANRPRSTPREVEAGVGAQDRRA